MRKKILCMLLLIMISMLTGCESDFLGRLFLPHIPELELPPLTVRIYQDLSSEEWDINYYNGINLYKIDGNVYFKDEFRVNKIVGSKFEKQILFIMTDFDQLCFILIMNFTCITIHCLNFLNFLWIIIS